MTLEATIIREPYKTNETCIIGKLELYDGSFPVFSCKTLELPWNNNRRNVSCIRGGRYTIERRTHGRYYKAYNHRWGHEFSLEIPRVQGRGDILIHTGNFKKHTRGCILVGDSVFHDFSGPSLRDSRRAYNRLYIQLRDHGQPWNLTIVGEVNCDDESEDVGDRSDL